MQGFLVLQLSFTTGLEKAIKNLAYVSMCNGVCLNVRKLHSFLQVKYKLLSTYDKKVGKLLTFQPYLLYTIMVTTETDEIQR
jgi:hypothetical protein